jgi:hypothetical protein
VIQPIFDELTDSWNKELKCESCGELRPTLHLDPLSDSGFTSICANCAEDHWEKVEIVEVNGESRKCSADDFYLIGQGA